MTTDLFPYQAQGAAFLASLPRAALFDVPGLGKSAQAIRAARAVGAQRPLVIGPASVVSVVWPSEWRRWWPGGPTPLCLSYDKLVRSAALRAEIERYRPDVLIIDESHYLKSPKAKRTKVMLGSAKDGPGVVNLPSLRHTWLLSGTPAKNGPHELFPMLARLWPGKLRAVNVHSEAEFWATFCFYTITEYGRFCTGAKNAPALREMLSDISLRRKWADVENQLPDLDIRTQTIARGGQHPELDDLEAHLLALVDRYAEDGAPIQNANFARWRSLSGVAKAGPTAALLVEEMKGGEYERLVCFAYHRNVLDILDAAFRTNGIPVYRIDGSTPVDQRAAIVDGFQNGPAGVALLQNQAGGEGITLTAAADIVVVEPPLTPTDLAQMLKRVHRLGQTRVVHARICALADSIDATLARLLATKTRTLSDLGLAPE